MKTSPLVCILLFFISCGEAKKSHIYESKKEDTSKIIGRTAELESNKKRGPKITPIDTPFADFILYQDNQDPRLFYVLPLLLESIQTPSGAPDFLFTAFQSHTKDFEDDDTGFMRVRFSGVQNERYNAFSIYFKTQFPESRLSALPYERVEDHLWYKDLYDYENRVNLSEEEFKMDSFSSFYYSFGLTKDVVMDVVRKIKNRKFYFGSHKVEVRVIDKNQNEKTVWHKVFFGIPNICKDYPYLMDDGDFILEKTSLCQ